MDIKIFIATDVRCGGTTFTSLFNTFSLKTIDDPQTRCFIKNEPMFNNYKTRKNRTNLLLDYCYNNLNFNVIKCSYISFSCDEYNQLLDYCNINNIIIIVLHRENIYKRSLSLELARNNLGWDVFENKNHKTVYINPKIYLNNIMTYNKKIKNCINYLNSNKKEYFFIVFEDFITSEKLCFSLYNKLKLVLSNKKWFKELKNKDYQTDKKLQFVANLKEITNLNKNVSKPVLNIKSIEL